MGRQLLLTSEAGAVDGNEDGRKANRITFDSSRVVQSHKPASPNPSEMQMRKLFNLPLPAPDSDGALMFAQQMCLRLYLNQDKNHNKIFDAHNFFSDVCI